MNARQKTTCLLLARQLLLLLLLTFRFDLCDHRLACRLRTLFPDSQMRLQCLSQILLLLLLLFVRRSYQIVDANRKRRIVLSHCVLITMCNANQFRPSSSLLDLQQSTHRLRAEIRRSESSSQHSNAAFALPLRCLALRQVASISQP